ncbi:uncharacterized protein LOC119070765 isoform X1 [Bradysia coprophila]|uniref:uncharacterized protein LOC119070765 isoform X1 n=1 Tax=Bradysia coprophila TaxID=38358 RepID=UPI00187DA213|nr:uncharacterized protein LOC119070765 isoform X1 [Bradysia coprophila]XP_037031141.1 uncharacterized protein LOC119070765 isoform X1 [Bradysia coprophila]
MASIETLPADVLLHVFGYLDGKSLKNAALVCRFWNDVISGSSIITKNFALNLSDATKWITKFDEVMSLNRRFQSINVRLHSTDSSDQRYVNETWTDNAIELLLQIAGRHGSSVRRLVLQNGEFENPDDFCSIFRCMPLLNELIIVRVKVNVRDDFVNENRSMLSELNKLTVHTCNWNIFKLFMASPVKELLIANKFTFVDDQQRAAYMNFLAAATELESIEFDYAAFGKTFRNEVDGNTSLKLQRLKYLSFSPVFEDDINRNFGLFLESQAALLTELDLNYTSSDIVKIIFTKLKHLAKLRLNAVVLPTDTAFYGSFRSMLHLKHLNLHDDIPSDVCVKEILMNCGNLETLSVMHDPGLYVSNLHTFMAANTPMLKSLSLNALPAEISPEAKFNHLKFLHINACPSYHNLIKFLDNNDTVETLSMTLNTETVPDDTILLALLNRPNLAHLIVTTVFSELNAIYGKIKLDYQKLKSLELRMAGTDDYVLIRFPNDKSKWQPKQLKMLFENQRMKLVLV